MVEPAVMTQKLQSEIEKQAHTIYYRYCSQGGGVQMDAEDLKSVGIIGALEAAERFDSTKGRWSVFARQRARGAMLDKVRKMALVSMGQDGYEKIKLLRTARQELSQRGLIPTNEALAEQLNWSLKDVAKWLALRPVLVPTAHCDSYADDDDNTPGMVLRSQDIGPEIASMRVEAKEIVEGCLDRLPSPELRMILLSRIVHGVKLKDLATSFDCAMQSILNKQKKAAEWMRQCIKSKGWPDKGWGKLFAQEGDS